MKLVCLTSILISLLSSLLFARSIHSNSNLTLVTLQHISTDPLDIKVHHLPLFRSSVIISDCLEHPLSIVGQWRIPSIIQDIHIRFTARSLLLFAFSGALRP
jgi:hypothetical protein